MSDKTNDELNEVGTETAPAHKIEGESNGLPPIAPEMPLDTPVEVVELEQFFHRHVKGNPVHSENTDHYNRLFHLKEAMRLELHAVHPAAKET